MHTDYVLLNTKNNLFFFLPRLLYLQVSALEVIKREESIFL